MEKKIEFHKLQIEGPSVPSKFLEDINAEGLKYLNKYHEAIN